MLAGTYRHSMDTKKRIRIPVQIKADLGNDYQLSKGIDDCIQILPKSYAEKLSVQLSGISIFDTDAQQSARRFFAGLKDVEEDAQGRILLPEELRTYAHITKDVVIIGCGQWAEIWDAATYDGVNDESKRKSELKALKGHLAS